MYIIKATVASSENRMNKFTFKHPFFILVFPPLLLSVSGCSSTAEQRFEAVTTTFEQHNQLRCVAFPEKKALTQEAFLARMQTPVSPELTGKFYRLASLQKSIVLLSGVLDSARQDFSRLPADSILHEQHRFFELKLLALLAEKQQCIYQLRRGLNLHPDGVIRLDFAPEKAVAELALPEMELLEKAALFHRSGSKGKFRKLPADEISCLITGLYDCHSRCLAEIERFFHCRRLIDRDNKLLDSPQEPAARLALRSRILKTELESLDAAANALFFKDQLLKISGIESLSADKLENLRRTLSEFHRHYFVKF